MRTLSLACLVAVGALSACGGGTQAVATQPNATTTAVSAGPATTPIALSDANAYAKPHVGSFKERLRAAVSAVGKAHYECVPAAAEGQFTCQYTAAFRKLDDCGLVTVTEAVGPGQYGAQRVGKPVQRDVVQGCFIGANGEAVPDKP